MDVYTRVYEERSVTVMHTVDRTVRAALVGGMCAVCLGSLVNPLLGTDYPLAMQAHLAWIGAAGAALLIRAKGRSG